VSLGTLGMNVRKPNKAKKDSIQPGKTELTSSEPDRAGGRWKVLHETIGVTWVSHIWEKDSTSRNESGGDFWVGRGRGGTSDRWKI